MHVSHAAFIHVPGQFIVNDSSFNSGRCTQQQGFYLLNDENSIPSASPIATVSKAQQENHPPAATEEYFVTYDFFGVEQDLPATQQAVFRKSSKTCHVSEDEHQTIPRIGITDSALSCASNASASNDDYGDFFGLVFTD
jgi:hypothetical protein